MSTPNRRTKVNAPWAVPLLAAGLLAVAAPIPAQAFDLFGLKLFEPDAKDLGIVDPLDYSVSIKVDPDNPTVLDAMNAASGLVADAGRPASGSLGLIAKARDDRQRLVAALYELARYDGTVSILIDGRDLDTLPPDTAFSGSGPVPVAIAVHPGKVFHIGKVTLLGQSGGLDAGGYGLVAGGDAASTTILNAESSLVRALREAGHPYARISDRSIVADHARAAVDVTLTFAAGPVANFGQANVEGAQTVDPGFIARMANIPTGKRFTPVALSEARSNLLDLGLFSSVSIKPAGSLAADGTVPVVIKVAERKQHVLGIGATISNTEGLGIEGYWGHRNLFGQGESLRFDGGITGIGNGSDLGRLNYTAALVYGKPGIFGPGSKLTAGLSATFEHPDAYDRFSVGANVGLSRAIDKQQTVSGELHLDWSEITDAFGTSRHLLASVPLQYVYDSRDSTLDPTTGYRLVAFAQPAYDLKTGIAFLKFSGEASAYHSLDANADYVLAGRFKAGSIAGAALADIPADQRYYAGGGGSVRGYAYQGIGPRDGSNTPTGGRSLIEASAELRVRVTDTIGVVPFIDAGSVSASQTPDFGALRFGAGVGLRYLTDFGPLRVDVAVPLNRRPGDPAYGIYAGIGQSF
ncbi:MAG TPA: autotransporter assembly complex family protein [Devosiaceae bacterium]